MKYNDLTWGQMEAICNKLGGDEGIAKFLRGDLILTEKEKSVMVESTIDFLIKVDRSKKPTYPDWVKKVIHPEFELSGPTEFDLKNVSLWLHEDQKTVYTTGNKIYQQLKKDDLLKDCLNLADLLAIQEKGIETFRNLYKGKAVFGWKSVVEFTYGYLYVPCLIEHGGGVVLHWRWLDNYWYSDYPALRFSK